MGKLKQKRQKAPLNSFPVIYLYCVDPGTDNECWVICAKGDPGALPFMRA